MPIPETHLNTIGRMREWYFTDSDTINYELYEAYLNGHMVFKKALELFLPDPFGPEGNGNATINMRTFIDARNPDGYESIILINNFTQPQIITGNLTGLEVELENNVNIYGNANSADALILTSPITLTNRGWIRGAGGAGGRGGSGSSSRRLSGTWSSRGSYDDPRYISGSNPDGSPIIVNGYQAGKPGRSCGSGYFNRFWKTGGGSKSGAWVSTGCSGQHYWNTSASSGDTFYFGNQGLCHDTSPDRHRVRHRSGTGMWILQSSYQYHNGGGGGAGGNGQQFNMQAGGAGGSAGGSGSVTGPNPGFSTSSGLNYTDNGSILAGLAGGTGGTGAGWAGTGSSGNPSSGGNAGAAGGAGGYAIRGVNNLLPGSQEGNLTGGTI